MLKWLSGFVDRVFVVCGALLFAQAPHFFQSYTQRLGGHLAELHIQISSVTKAAAFSGKSLDAYIQKFSSHEDIDVASQGEILTSMLTRFSTINETYNALIHSTPLSKPFLFLKHFQSYIVKSTLADYQLGVTFTMEAGAYALFGMGVGYLAFKVIENVWKTLYSTVVKYS